MKILLISCCVVVVLVVAVAVAYRCLDKALSDMLAGICEDDWSNDDDY